MPASFPFTLPIPRTPGMGNRFKHQRIREGRYVETSGQTTNRIRAPIMIRMKGQTPLTTSSSLALAMADTTKRFNPTGRRDHGQFHVHRHDHAELDQRNIQGLDDGEQDGQRDQRDGNGLEKGPHDEEHQHG